MTIPSWATQRSPWDILKLDGKEIPGIATVTGKVGEKLDVQNVKGTKGVKTTDEGPDGATLTITLEQSLEEANAFELMIDSIHPRKNNLHPNPLTIEYPSVNTLGITKIKIKSIALPVVDPDNDTVTWVIEAIEHFDNPKPVKSYPKKSTGAKYDPFASSTNTPLSGVAALDDKYPRDPWNTDNNFPY